MTDYTISAPNPNGWTDRYYGPPHPIGGGEIHPILRCSGILPDPAVHPEPEDGYPAVLFTNSQGYTQSSLLTTVGDAQVPQQLLLDRGIAIISFTVPAIRDPLTGVDVDQDPEDFNPSAGEYGDSYRGNGVLTQVDKGPGEPVGDYPGAFPTGYEAANPGRPHPWLDPLWLNPWKACEDIVRHARHHAVQGTGELPVNRDKLWLFGSSSGAQSVAWAALGGDKALVPENISAGGQQAQSTRVAGASLVNWTLSFLAWKTELSNGGPAAWQFAVPGSGNDWDEAAEDVAAASSGNLRTVLSPIYWLQQTAEWEGMSEANAALPVWISNNAPLNADVLANASRYTTTFGHIGTTTNGETQPHSAYTAYLAPKFLPLARTILTDEDHVDLDALEAGAPRQVDAVIADTNERWLDMVTFIESYIGSPPTAEEQAYSALKARLETITLANGYQTGVRRVYRFDEIPERMPTAPAIVVRSDRTEHGEREWAGAVDKTVYLDLQLIIQGWQRHEARLARFEADVEKALRTDHTLGGVVENVDVTSAERHLLNPATRDGAFSILQVRVLVRHEHDDPYTILPSNC